MTIHPPETVTFADIERARERLDDELGRQTIPLSSGVRRSIR